jgi:hypothetical protein
MSLVIKSETRDALGERLRRIAERMVPAVLYGEAESVSDPDKKDIIRISSRRPERTPFPGCARRREDAARRSRSI